MSEDRRYLPLREYENLLKVISEEVEKLISSTPIGKEIIVPYYVYLSPNEDPPRNSYSIRRLESIRFKVTGVRNAVRHHYSVCTASVSFIREFVTDRKNGSLKSMSAQFYIDIPCDDIEVTRHLAARHAVDQILKQYLFIFSNEAKEMNKYEITRDGVRYTGTVDDFSLIPSTGCHDDPRIKMCGRISYATPVDDNLEMAEKILKEGRDQLVKACQFDYKKIVYSNGVTTILWKDGTKTTVRPAEGEEPNPGAGIAYCFMKKALGNKNGHNKVLRKEVPAVLAAEKKRRVEKDRKRMDKDLKKYQKEKENGETENS